MKLTAEFQGMHIEQGIAHIYLKTPYQDYHMISAETRVKEFLTSGRVVAGDTVTVDYSFNGPDFYADSIERGSI